MRVKTLIDLLHSKMAQDGLSYRELARKVDVPLTSLWRFLNGRGGLNISSIEKLMKHYNLGVVELPARPKRKKGRNDGQN